MMHGQKNIKNVFCV